MSTKKPRAYTEDDAHRFEAVFLAIESSQTLKAAVATLKTDDTTRAWKHWTFETLVEMVESQPYRAWRDDYCGVMKERATLLAFRDLANPEKGNLQARLNNALAIAADRRFDKAADNQGHKLNRRRPDIHSQPDDHKAEDMFGEGAPVVVRPGEEPDDDR